MVAYNTILQLPLLLKASIQVRKGLSLRRGLPVNCLGILKKIIFILHFLLENEGGGRYGPNPRYLRNVPLGSARENWRFGGPIETIDSPENRM